MKLTKGEPTTEILQTPLMQAARGDRYTQRSRPVCPDNAVSIIKALLSSFSFDQHARYYNPVVSRPHARHEFHIKNAL